MDEIGWANGTLLPCSMCLASRSPGLSIGPLTMLYIIQISTLNGRPLIIASPLEQRFPFHLTFSYTPLHFRLLLFHVYLYIFRCVTIYLYIIITL